MRYLRSLLFLLAVLSIVGCDHATKVVAAKTLGQGEVEPIISGVLAFEQVRNTDTAFGLLSTFIPTSSRLLLLKATATLGLLLVALLSTLRYPIAGPLERLALAAILGGAAGNALDRWLWGYVVDFIHLRYWPVFNVADIALCVGAMLLGWSQRRQVLRARAPSAR